jgi:hypothetical protein
LKTGLQPIVWGRSRFTYQFCYGPFYMPFALHNWYYLRNKCCYITTQALGSAFFFWRGGGGGFERVTPNSRYLHFCSNRADKNPYFLISTSHVELYNRYFLPHS